MLPHLILPKAQKGDIDLGFFVHLQNVLLPTTSFEDPSCGHQSLSQPKNPLSPTEQE